MDRWTQEHIEECAKDMATTEELCGDVRNAIIQYADDNDLPRPSLEIRESLYYRFNEIWRSYQKDAGVNPRYWRV